MKITKAKLQQLIKEEIGNMQEADLGDVPGWENWKDRAASRKHAWEKERLGAHGGFRPEVDEGAKKNAVDILGQLAAFLEDGNPTAEDVLDVEWAVVNLSKQIFKNM
jgi:hypothetical protein